MAYCGRQRVPDGTVCGVEHGEQWAGTVATLLPDGKGGSSTSPSAGPDSLTGQWTSQQDTTPVQMGTTRGTGLGGNIAVPLMTVVADAKEEFNRIRGAAFSPNATQAEKDAYQNLVSGLRRYSNEKLGTRSAVESAWGDLLKDASRGNRDALDLLNSGTSPEADGSTGSGSGGYTGPVSTVTQLAEPDVRLVADQIASTVLGRAVTEQEFKTVLQKVRGLEQANPSVSGAGVASQTNVSGLSQAAREDVITRALLKQDGAEEFTLATKMMGLYRKALQEMPNG